MDFKTDIEKPVLYWVRNASGTPASSELWGAALACTHGLGGDARRFRGKAALISPATRWEGEVSISRVHVNGKGCHLHMSSQKNSASYPETPFLITDYLPLRFLRAAQIDFDPVHMWEELENDDGRLGEYFVCGTEWLGVLRVDKARSKRTGLLWIFSDRASITLPPGTTLAFCADPSETFAHVTRDG